MRFTTRQYIMNHPVYKDTLTGLEATVCKSYPSCPMRCAWQTWMFTFKAGRKVAVLHG